MTLNMGWDDCAELEPKSYICGFCGDKVGSNIGYRRFSSPTKMDRFIYICPSCGKPSYFQSILSGYPQTPSPPFGSKINIRRNKKLEELILEAKSCISNGLFTAATLCCRKILMHIAVDKGANNNRNFIDYTNFLLENNIVPSDAKKWLEEIRKKGNEANHEVRLIPKNEAEIIYLFCEMLAKIIYEYPNLVETPE